MIMDLTRRQSLQLMTVLSALATAPGLAACGREPGGRAPGAKDVELAGSEIARSPGSGDAIPDAIASVSALAAGLYGALAVTPGNLAFSPYSVAVALGMTLNGARGRTAAEMRDVLRAPELGRFNGGLAALSLHLEGLAGPIQLADGREKEIVLDTANALFGQRGTTWQRPFLDDLARYYGAGMRLVDYVSATETARTLINSWTARQTHDKIPVIVPPGELDLLTRLVLVNAVYFKAPWQSPFDPRSTRRMPFATDTGRTVDAPTMTEGLEEARWGAGDGWEAVRLEYAGGTLAMTIVLPERGSFDRVSAAVADGGLVGMLAAPRPGGVMLSLPRWTFRTQVSLRETLATLGMRTAFDPQAADFSGMTREEQLFVSSVLHEAFVVVDEEGTEAAAATSVEMGTTSAPMLEHEVVVDRPFFFVIHDVEHLTPLFVGRVTDPTA
jgi:serpin B